MHVSPEDHIRQLLEPGERLLWAGKPDRRPRTVVFDFVGGLALAAAQIVVSIAVFTRTDGWFRIVMGPFFLLGGLNAGHMLISESRRERRTVYGLTSKRAIISLYGRKPEIRSIPLRSMYAAKLGARNDCSGSIVGVSAANEWTYRTSHTDDRIEVPLFFSIAEPQAVLEILQDVIARKQAPAIAEPLCDPSQDAVTSLKPRHQEIERPLPTKNPTRNSCESSFGTYGRSTSQEFTVEQSLETILWSAKPAVEPILTRQNLWIFLMSLPLVVAPGILVR